VSVHDHVESQPGQIPGRGGCAEAAGVIRSLHVVAGCCIAGGVLACRIAGGGRPPCRRGASAALGQRGPVGQGGRAAGDDHGAACREPGVARRDGAAEGFAAPTAIAAVRHGTGDAAWAASKDGRRPKPPRGVKRDAQAITAERVLKAAVPAGSRFKGYEDILVRDLRLSAEVVRYRRERWVTPSGETVLVPVAAAGGPCRLCGQRGGAGLHARAWPVRPGGRPAGRAPGQAVRRHGGVGRAPGPARHRRARGHP